jgi:hypothetical protein
MVSHDLSIMDRLKRRIDLVTGKLRSIQIKKR